jgi:hypothetical protein
MRAVLVQECKFIFCYLVFVRFVAAANTWEPRQGGCVILNDLFACSCVELSYAYHWSPAKSGLPKLIPVQPSQAEALVPRKREAGLYDRVETQPGMLPGLYHSQHWLAPVCFLSHYLCLIACILTGLHSYALSMDVAGMRAHGLQPLLTWARAVVPAEQHRTTPVFLLGTAGLRGLQPAEMERLMTEARQILGSSGFR